jgi:HAE1 family hydrophobic/amphiphilic exporter-1
MKRIAGITGGRGYLWTIGVFFLIVSMGILSDTSAFGEGKQVEVLTLEETLRIAAEKNLDIQKAREYRNLVEGIYVTERAAVLPQIVIGARANNERDQSQKAVGPNAPLGRNTRSAEVGLSQALFTWGQIGAAIRAAKMGIATADDQLRLFRQAAFRDVTASFYDTLLAKELHAIAIQNLEQKRRHYDEAQKKYAAGVATDYDVLVGKVDVENTQPPVIRTENLIRISREKLRFLLGTESKEVDVKGTLETEILPYPDYQEAEEIAKKNRPELSDFRHRIQVTEELVKIAQAGDKPRLDLKAGYGWQDLDLGQGYQASGQMWSAGLFVTYPIFDGLRTRGQVAQAKSHLATLKIEEAKLLNSIRLEIRDAVNAVRESAEIIRALSGTVARAERLLSMAEKGYEYGVKTKLEVDDAQLSLVQALGNLATAKRDYLVARVTYEWATGTLGERGIKSETLKSKLQTAKVKGQE